MHFHDDSLFPETQDKLVITVAPYGPEWEPDDFAEDLPLSMDEHVQQAVDCFNAGATVLHIHVRELDGKGSKRLSKFNELLGRLREAVPEMILQVGGSISFAPEGEGADAKWLSDDVRHMLAELEPAPDQVTIAINTSQMNIMELMTDDDIAGTSMQRPELADTYREMTVPAGPEWVAEHLRRLQAAGIQPHFQLSSIPQLETVERLIRRGIYTGPVNLTWVAIGGGFDGPNPYNMMNFVQRVPDGACLTLETLMRSVLPVNTMAIAMGLHARCGNEDTIWGRKGEKMTSVQQIEQLVRIAGELGREVATAKEARDIYRIGETYADTDETLAKLGYAPTAGSASWDSRSTPEFAPSRTTVPGVRTATVRTPESPRLPRVLPRRVMGLQAPATPRVDTALGIGGRRKLYPWIVFALAFGLLLSDYMSRQVLSAVFPILKADWDLSDSHLASLSSVVALMVGLLTFPLSLLADRWGRVKSLILMAVLWSVATLLCAIAQTYEQMLGARFLVGVGEAAYGSVGIAVVLSVFAPRVHAALAGAFMAGGSFGSVIGVAIGGFIAVQFSWRWSFAAWQSSV